MTSDARGLVLTSFDRPAAMGPIKVPEPEPGQVLIEVRASSINAFDWKVADGALRHAFQYEFPVTIGRDYAGVVIEVGADVTRVEPGDEVFGYLGGPRLHRGAFATHLIVGEQECFTAKPAVLSFEQAACLPLSGVVALRCIDAVSLNPGDVVLVVGAPGGVGSLAVQLAVAKGARVIASGTPADVGYLTALGASDVALRGDEFAAEVRKRGGVDAMIDLVNNREAFVALLGLVKAGGRVASVHRGADPADLDERKLTGANIMSNPDRSLLEELGRLAADGELRIPIERIVRLDDLAEALPALRSGHAQGKTAVTIPPTLNV